MIVYKSREADLSGTAPISAIIGILFELAFSTEGVRLRPRGAPFEVREHLAT